MAALRTKSIRHKLILMIMLGSTFALLLSAAAFVTYEVVTYKKTLALELQSLAAVIGANSHATILFGEEDQAQATVESLEANPTIVSASMYSWSDTNSLMIGRFPESELEATFPKPERGEKKQWVEENYLLLFEPVEFDGEIIGTIFLKADTNALNVRFMSFAGIVILVLLASSLATAWLSAKLQRVVSEPIEKLLNTASTVGKDQNFAIRAEKHSEDEFGILVDGFNNMLSQIQVRDKALQDAQDTLELKVQERTRELKSVHEQLLVISRRAGMAEVATTVLHNVGNVLNSVNVSAGLLTDQLRTSELSNLRKAAALMKTHVPNLPEFLTEDPKGKLLPEYLLNITDHLAVEQNSTREELDLLARNVEHIKDIVAKQQSHATVSGLIEVIAIIDLLEIAMEMNVEAFARHRIQVVRNYSAKPLVAVDKHNILQILVNLIRNAKAALVTSQKDDKCLTLGVDLYKDHHVTITIRDNGIGIAPENLTRIFSFGFTTKNDGHGFGLHSGALSAKESGGSLTAFSNGIGKGAVFTLELPTTERKHG